MVGRVGKRVSVEPNDNNNSGSGPFWLKSFAKKPDPKVHIRSSLLYLNSGSHEEKVSLLY